MYVQAFMNIFIGESKRNLKFEAFCSIWKFHVCPSVCIALGSQELVFNPATKLAQTIKCSHIDDIVIDSLESKHMIIILSDMLYHIFTFLHVVMNSMTLQDKCTKKGKPTFIE